MTIITASELIRRGELIEFLKSTPTVNLIFDYNPEDIIQCTVLKADLDTIKLHRADFGTKYEFPTAYIFLNDNTIEFRI